MRQRRSLRTKPTPGLGETQGSREGLQRPLLAGRVSVLPVKEGAGEEAEVSAFKLHPKLGPGWDITQDPPPLNAFDYGEAACEPLNPPAPREPGKTEGCRRGALESCLFI